MGSEIPRLILPDPLHHTVHCSQQHVTGVPEWKKTTLTLHGIGREKQEGKGQTKYSQLRMWHSTVTAPFLLCHWDKAMVFKHRQKRWT